MDIPIPAALEQFIQEAVTSGRYGNAAEVVGEALRLLERRERLGQDVAAGVEQLDRGQYREYDEDAFERFAGDVEVERTRLAKKKP